MGKKYKGKVCVYCGEHPSESGNHVISRELFVKSARGNLPQVPACKPCNVAKSALETYATAVLPFGGRHVDAPDNLQMVEGRLARNQKLSRTLSHGTGLAWTRAESGVIVRSLTIPIDGEKIGQLFCYIAKGLAAHHWSTVMGSGVMAEAHFLTREGERYFDQLLRLTAKQRASGNPGNGVLDYRGAQGTGDATVSVWVFRIYGGVSLAGDEDTPSEVSSAVGVLTGPGHTFERAKLRRAWLTGARLLG